MQAESISVHPMVETILRKHAATVMPLTAGPTIADPDSTLLLQTPAETLFPGARNPKAAVSGLLLLSQQWDASHSMAQDIASIEGSYWHAIAHRLEPDSFNASYWFRWVGQHPIFPALREEANGLLRDAPDVELALKPKWDPFVFIEWCDRARKHTDSPLAQVMRKIQKAEWQLLFAWCSQAVI